MIRLTTSKADLHTAARVLRRGGVVVIPTDTAYGLAVDPRQSPAVKRIFKIKQRPPEKALPWVAGSLAQVERFFQLTATDRRLAKHFWPGPLSIVLHLKRSKKKIAVRVPALTPLRKLCLLHGYPLTATSANLSGHPNCYSVRAVVRQLKQSDMRPDIIIDGGQLARRRPSTIVEHSSAGLVTHRSGPISQRQIEPYV